MNDIPEPQEDTSAIRRTLDAFNVQMEQAYGPLAKVELSQETPPDIDAFRHEAVIAARSDIERIQENYQRLTADLGGIGVDLLQRDPFSLPEPEAAAARQSVDAITRAKQYLGLAISEGPATEQRSREYAATVTQAWPRLERWNRRQNIRLLQDEVSACAITLAKIRLVQVEIDAMASYTGVPHVPLLNPALLT